MNARNGPHGYGFVTKTLHWLTVGLVVAQFVVGYVMRGDDSGGGQGRGCSEARENSLCGQRILAPNLSVLDA